MAVKLKLHDLSMISTDGEYLARNAMRLLKCKIGMMRKTPWKTLSNGGTKDFEFSLGRRREQQMKVLILQYGDYYTDEVDDLADAAYKYPNAQAIIRLPEEDGN